MDQLRRAADLRVHSACVRRALGSDRAATTSHRLRRRRDAVHCPAAHRGFAGTLRAARLRPDDARPSINAVVKAELFPARIRALGVGLPYALTVAIFGGTTEYVALGLKNIGHESWFFFYVAGCGLISLLVYVFMGEPSRRSQLERETRELGAGEREQVKVDEVVADPA